MCFSEKTLRFLNVNFSGSEKKRALFFSLTANVLLCQYNGFENALERERVYPIPKRSYCFHSASTFVDFSWLIIWCYFPKPKVTSSNCFVLSETVRKSKTDRERDKEKHQILKRNWNHKMFSLKKMISWLTDYQRCRFIFCQLTWIRWK